jgi:nucleoside-diphosphate-sugar epimerase
VLVGGGCGFLGSYLVPELVGSGAQVTVADNLSNGDLARLGVVQQQCRFVEADLRDAAICERLVERQDVVFNLAAKAYGMEYSRFHNGEMLVYNLLCSLALLEAARQKDVSRFVVFSSSCVYPDDAPVPTPELDTFTGLPERVNEGYGWAKRMQELAASYYSRDYGMKLTVVRPFNPYGANYRWGSEEKAHVVPALVKRILDGQEDPVVIWGSGRQRRNFLHAGDAARLILLVTEADTSAEPVNIGYEEDTSIADLVTLICELAGRTPRIEFDTSKPEGRFRKCADSARLRRLTEGYVPRVSLRDGILEMLDWHRRSFGGAQGR